MFSDRVRVVIDRVDRLRDQVEDHWQIPRDEALVLAQLVRIGRCISICEIGTSYVFRQRPKTGLEPSKVVLYHFAQHSVRHGDPLGRYGGRYNAPPLASRHRLQTLGT